MPGAFIKSREVPASRCPHCDKVLDAITGAGSSPEETIPTIGRLSVCVYCGTLLEIIADGIQAAAAARLGELSEFERKLLEETIDRPIRAATGSPSDPEKRNP
jgi:hypothetical protein